MATPGLDATRQGKNKGEDLSSPYGPQNAGEDAASGGADSSPLENLPSDERTQAMKEMKENASGPNSPG